MQQGAQRENRFQTSPSGQQKEPFACPLDGLAVTCSRHTWEEGQALPCSPETGTIVFRAETAPWTSQILGWEWAQDHHAGKEDHRVSSLCRPETTDCDQALGWEGARGPELGSLGI